MSRRDNELVDLVNFGISFNQTFLYYNFEYDEWTLCPIPGQTLRVCRIKKIYDTDSKRMASDLQHAFDKAYNSALKDYKSIIADKLCIYSDDKYTIMIKVAKGIYPLRLMTSLSPINFNKIYYVSFNMLVGTLWDKVVWTDKMLIDIVNALSSEPHKPNLENASIGNKRGLLCKTTNIWSFRKLSIMDILFIIKSLDISKEDKTSVSKQIANILVSNDFEILVTDFNKDIRLGNVLKLIPNYIYDEFNIVSIKGYTNRYELRKFTLKEIYDYYS